MAIDVRVFAAQEAAETALADEITVGMRAATPDEPFVLGLATGRTPLGVYAELVRRHREEGLSFRNVVTFNLDEFDGIARTERGSFHRFMHEALFDHVDCDPARTHLLPPDAGGDHVAACAEFEAAIAAVGGIDLQVLGVGLNGHIGFNEPGSPAGSRTRRVELHPVTCDSYAASLESAAPTHALTMGVATILEARRLRVLALGGSKAEIVAEMMRGEPRAEVPATFLHGHPDVQLLVDEAAASALNPKENA